MVSPKGKNILDCFGFFGSTFVVMVASLSSKNTFIMYFLNFIRAAMMDAYQWTNLNSNNLLFKLVPSHSIQILTV